MNDAANAARERAPDSDLLNDLVTVGEEAARAFVRGAAKLKSLIEAMALGLAEAKRRYPKTTIFGEWLKTSPYASLGRNDRSALIRLGRNWSDNLAGRIAELDSYSPELIAKALLSSDNLKDDDDGEDEDEENETDSTFYGDERRARDHEKWDTLDPRLVRSLVEAMPGLKRTMVWEPAVGKGLMVDQLEANGVSVYATTDIEPRRDDIAEQDLLACETMAKGCSAIITNPPWGRLAAPFVRHCLKLAEPEKAIVCMLLPLPWIAGRGIADLTGSPGFDALVVPRYRARWMTPEEEAELAKAMEADGKVWAPAPKMNHCWLCWDFARDPTVAPVIEFVDAPADDPDDAEPDPVNPMVTDVV